MLIVINLFIVLGSMFFIPGTNLRISQEIFFQLATMAIFASMFFENTKPVKRNQISMAIGAFAVYAITLFLLSDRTFGGRSVMNIFRGTLLYFVVLQLDSKNTKFVIKTILWTCLVHMIYMLFQAWGFDFIFLIRPAIGQAAFENIGTDLNGLLALKSVMGMWMGLGLIASFIINPFLGLFFLVPIYISKCSGVFFGLALAVPFYLFWVKRKLFWILLPVIVGAGLAYVIFVDSPMGMMNTRPPMWKMACRDTVYGNGQGSRFLRNMLTGNGPDSFREGKLRYYKYATNDTTIRMIIRDNSGFDVNGKPFLMDANTGQLLSPDSKLVDWWDDPHNEFIKIFYEYGLFGLILLGWFLYWLGRYFRYSQKPQELVLVASLIIFLFGSATTQFPFSLARIGYILPILLGLFVVNLTDSKEE